MFDKLLGTLQRSGAIAATLLIANAVKVNSQEYVFSAPSEVDRQLVEIPASETDYPLYECEQHEEADSDSETSEAIDSHDCDCIDCKNSENNSRDSAAEKQVASQNQRNK